MTHHSHTEFVNNHPPPPYEPKPQEFGLGSVPPKQSWGNPNGAPPPGGQTNHVVVVSQVHGKAPQFGTEPAVTTCTNCHQTVTTVVTDEIRQGGWIWCLACTFLFSWIVGVLACCLNGFKKFTHRCPRCNQIISQVEARLTKKEMGIIAAVTAVVLVIVILLWIFVLIPIYSRRYWHWTMSSPTQLRIFC